MDRNDIKVVYSEDKNYLTVSEMITFLTDLALKTEDIETSDKLMQCSIFLNVIAETKGIKDT
jgi:hypothetical protein